MTLGTIIQQYRKEHQLSMDDFAQLSGISKAYISILERNYNPSTKRPAIPSLPTIKAVATAMRLDFNDLLYRLDPDQKIALPSDEKEPTTPQDDGLWKDICADEKKLMLARWISGLNQEELQRVVKLLDAALLLPKE